MLDRRGFLKACFVIAIGIKLHPDKIFDIAETTSNNIFTSPCFKCGCQFDIDRGVFVCRNCCNYIEVEEYRKNIQKIRREGGYT